MFKENQIFKKFFLALFLLLLSSFVAAQTQEYKDYTVEKGDTLWDISNKELKDPFLWPKVWKENSDIKNPDLIYPGQKIRIPLYLLQKEIVPEKKPERKVERKPEVKPEIRIQKPVEKPIESVKIERFLVSKNVLIASGYIADSVHSIGMITDSQNNHTIFAKDDYAYIKTDSPLKKGDKFYIIRSGGKVTHPKTGRKLGYLIEVLGIAEVVDANKDDPKVLITDSYAEISPGYLLDTYYEIEPTLVPENPRKPDINGYIIATKQSHFINIPYDIVYIDKGRDSGLEVGDLLTTMLQSKHRIINGTIQIINVRASTATALVKQSKSEVLIGDQVTGVRQE